MDPLGAAQDPLGARLNIVESDHIKTWNTTTPPSYEVSGDSSSRKSPFVYDDVINSKVALW